jgi:hypothetical protein
VLPQILDPEIVNELQQLLLGAIGLSYSEDHKLDLAPSTLAPQEVLEQIKALTA